MSDRFVILLHTQRDRERLWQHLRSSPIGTRVEVKGPQRTLPQNDHMHGLIRDISEQTHHMGLKLDVETWKSLLLHAFGKEMPMILSLDGRSVIPLPQHSSDLSIQEMSAFIDWLYSYGEEKAVQFHITRSQWNPEGRF